MSNRRLLLSPLWFLVALATIVGLNATSAAAGSAAETRVRAFEHVTVDSVGQQSSEKPASVGCVRPETAAIASGSCVATEAAADVPAYARSQYGRVSPGSRGAVLEENPTCLYCGKSPSTQVDHVTSLKEDWNTGGWADDAASRTARVNDSGNLVGACQPCNGSKNALPLGEGSGQWWPSGWPSGVWWPFGGP